MATPRLVCSAGCDQRCEPSGSCITAVQSHVCILHTGHSALLAGFISSLIFYRACNTAVRSKLTFLVSFATHLWTVKGALKSSL